MKKTIRTKLAAFDKYSLQGPIADVIETLQTIVVDNPDKLDMLINIDTYYSYGDEYTEADIYYTREETDKEEKVREAGEARSLAQKKRQYEALKKEFG